MGFNKLDITVRPKGTAVIVDFGDIAIEIPTNLKKEITSARIDEERVVYIDINGTEDFLSITETVFGEPPYYRPFIYHIIKDTKGIGVEGLRELVEDLF